MSYSPFTATGDGSTTAYTIAFESIDTADIKARINNVATTAFSVSGSTVTFTTAPPSGQSIKIFRDTDNQTIQADFQSGSALRAVDLNSNFTQLLFVTQESTDVADTATTDASAAVVTANAANATANTASSNATTAVNTANTASTNATTAVNTANAATTTANGAVTTANAATATANTASTNASAAVSTSNTANTTAGNAVTTANTANTNSTAAVSTANTASTAASNAVTTANGAVSTANTASTNATTAVNTANAATTTANTADTNATAAVATANTASTNASNAVSTANAADTNATTSLTNSRESDGSGGFTSAISKANTAITTANAASSAVSNAVLFTLIANVAAIPGSPSNNDYVEIGNSTGIESFSPLSGLPSGFVGATGLTVRLTYQTSGSSWVFMSYFANDSEDRYLTKNIPVVTGDSTNGSGQITLNCENNSHGIKIKGPPHSAAASYTLTLPNDTGTNGQALITNGSGVTSWSTTVAGRDVSADGTKLDGIESAATADQTAAEILTAVKTVDGASSGLDADLLDGQHGSYYTGYTDTAVANLVDSSPAALNTLNELAAALGDDANFSTTVTNSIATKMPLAGGTFTGNVTLQANLDMQDNDKILIGTGDDLQIYHNNTDSFIENSFGDLYIRTLAGTSADDIFITSKDDVFIRVQDNEFSADFIGDGPVRLYYNNATKFATKSDGVDITGELECDTLDVDGNADISGVLTLHNNLDMQDNDKILIGSGDDLEIFHQGSYSEIRNNTNSGDLYIRNYGDDIFIRSADDIYIQPQGSENGISVIGNGAVNIYHNNSLKLETLSTGINVNGTITDSNGPLRRLGYRQSTSSFTLAATDAGKLVRMAGSGKTITVPNGVFSAGDMVSFFHAGTGTLTITAAGTMYNTADAATGNRTIAAKGMATLVCTDSNEFAISGSQLT